MREARRWLPRRHAIEEIANLLIFVGERGGTRTHDPMIKSHVLYRLSYALTVSIEPVPSVKRRTPPVVQTAGRTLKGSCSRRRCVGGGPVPVNSDGALINAGHGSLIP